MDGGGGGPDWRNSLWTPVPLEQTMPSSAPCYFLTRKSAGGESHQSLSHGNMHVKVGVEGAITISIFVF